MRKQLIEAVKNALLPELNQLNHKLDDLHHKVDINTVKIDETNKRIDNLRIEFNKRIDDLKIEFNKRIDDLKIEFNKRIDDTNDTMRNGFSNLQSQISQLRNDVSKLSDRNYNDILERIARLEARAS